jgi:hypothetical protein
MKDFDWVLAVSPIASQYLKISGYTGYGTKDGTFKYSAGAETLVLTQIPG